MKTSLLRHTITSLGLLAFLFAGQVGVQGYIWCLGENGHSTLEYAAGGGCDSAALEQDSACHQEEETLWNHARDEHCSPCVDLPASFETTSHRAQEHKSSLAQAQLPATFQIASRPTLAQTLTAGSYSQPPPRISQTLLAQRTVVLLN